jgi:hypothetical protein
VLTPTPTSTRRPMPTRTPTRTATPTQTPIAPSVGLILRAEVVDQPSGTVQTLYGGDGMIITDGGAYYTVRVDFPVGTWINPTSSKLCSYVPLVTGSGSPGIGVLSSTSNADGSGTMMVATGGGQPISIVVLSANC